MREKVRPALAVHGGAGLIRRDAVSPEREVSCRAGLREAVEAGAAVLRAGGSAVDAAEAAVVVLEEAPEFNAGRGAVLCAGGWAEHDAALADGRTRGVGAVAGVREVRNPIRAARLVLERTPHVLLCGAGADAWLRTTELERVAPEWYVVPERFDQLQRARETGAFHLDHGGADVYGTVGAVACDAEGHVAAATSTGGMVNKLPGRVGDSPIAGAGTFAWDRTCAVSATGHGEPILRLGAAGRVSALMELAGLSVEAASDRVVFAELPALHGAGGLIAVDGCGRLALPFNTRGMFRGWWTLGAEPEVAVW